MLKDAVIKAYEFAKEAHGSQIRKFAYIDFFTHPKMVARYVDDLTHDEDLVIAALLHDVVEDTNVTNEQIKEEFGFRVARLVKELTNDKNIKTMNKADFLSAKMYDLSAGALIVKLADRFHNILYLEKDNVPWEFVYRQWYETKRMIDALRNRTKNQIHAALIARIKAVLKFLEIRYNFSKAKYEKEFLYG